MRLYYLSDSYRFTRSFLVGTVSTCIFLPLFSVREALTLSTFLALAWDFVVFVRRTWLLGNIHTREIFSCSEARESLKLRLINVISGLFPTKPEWEDPEPIRKVLFEEFVIQ